MKKNKNNKNQNKDIKDVDKEFTSLSSGNKIQRKCIGCAKVFSRCNLLKITDVFDSGKIVINPDKKTFGRSVYLCYNNDCINKAFKKNKISKFLKANVDDSFINKIKDLLGEKNINDSR